MKQFEFSVSRWIAIIVVLSLGYWILSSGWSLPEARSAVPSASSTPSSDTLTTDQLIARERHRLEELFIWKMVEELKLSVEVETSFAEAIRALNREKALANKELSDSLFELGQAKTPKAKELALKKYEKAWRKYADLPIKEINRMRPILGIERLGQYLVEKSLMAEKLKSLSTSGKI